jgi:hypothetical protein
MENLEILSYLDKEDKNKIHHIVSSNDNPAILFKIIKQWIVPNAQSAKIIIKEKINDTLVTTESQKINKENKDKFVISQTLWCKITSMYAVDVMINFEENNARDEKCLIG